jgi:putative endopeptidase
MRTKNRRAIYNNSKTKKCKPSQLELTKYCKEHANTFAQFENKFESSFKGDLKKENASAASELVKMFKTPFTPSKVTPRNDFYTYINYQWLEEKTSELKKKLKYYVQVDSFRVTQEKVYYEIMDIVKDYIKTNNSKKATSIKNLYLSLYHLNDKAAERYIQYYLDLTNRRIANNNIYGILGGQNRNEIVSWGTPVVWSVLKDEKNVSIYRSYISAPQLTIYDYNIYIEDNEEDQATKKYKKLFKEKYFEFIDTLFDVCLGKSHEFKSSDIWECELDILTALGTNDVKEDDPEGYNIVTKKDALKYGLDWEQFTKFLGYKKAPPFFICSSLSYLKNIMKTLTTDDAWKSNKWKGYFLYISFRQVMRFHNKWQQIYYNFHGKFIRGQPVPYPKEVYPIFGLSLCYNTFLTNEYIERNTNQQYIDYTHNLAADLLVVYKRIIKRNTWLSPSTKKYALLKLEKIKLIVGSPKILREDPILDYSPTDAYQNIRRMAHWRTDKLLELDGKSSEVDIPIIDWEEFKIVGKQSYIVNAYYTPTENSIYVPLAYLQKPFIDLDERGIEYNLAHIGYTLGHEMSHCLDDMGSKYDEKGNLRNWWTKHDRRKFNKKVQNVITQYETFAAYDGIKMDASLSTGENLADISGIAICEEYLRDFQEKNADPIPIRSLSFNAFYIYLAIQARQKIYDEAIKAQLKINPHPMDKYRTNCPLARLELFKSLYNIKKGDKMYWPVSDTIW